ncbi:complement factor H isoform X1 [Oryzias melastigma]|uniref:complement factor H isoform X1 n=1 Tax=Oryzias melastigma TaxID=30732 RepID=UPI00168D3559|nr:complement factor H isoform X1 [Oryzias melastigma]
MWLVYCSFSFLVWLPGILSAQGTPQVCSAPNLENGYTVPMKASYQQNEKITYACEDGYKPAVEGWWAESTCGNGQWSPLPLCIEKSACIPPTVINEKYEEDSKLWYKNGDKKRITCNEGYDNKDYVATALCERGNWTIVPVCEKSKVACSEPPKIPYAVIINREHQDVFPVNSNVTYQCKDDYVTEEGAKIKSVFCTSGNWTTTPTCIYSPESNKGNTKPPFVPVENCGELPVVEHGLVEESENLALRVSCQRFYKLDGPEKVVCYSSNKWSEVPVCKANYCSVDTAAYEDLEPDGVKYVVNGEEIKLLCKDIFRFENHRYVRCRNGKATVSECCNRFQIYTSLNEREEEETVAFRISGWAENRYKHL